MLGGFAFKFQSESPHTKNYNLNSEYKVYALKIPDTVHFAGEKIPLTSPDLRERMDRELLVNTYWQSNTLLYFKRAKY